MKNDEVKQKIIDYSRKMLTDGLTVGTGGNISIRYNDNIFITPGGIDYDKLKPEDISVIDINGNHTGEGKPPSSEKLFHCDIYKKRENIKSIVHTHSVYAAVLSCLRTELPPVHYLTALSGKKVPLADYAPFGTKELSDNIVSVMEDYNAVLLSNHGLAAFGENIKQAYSTALNIEFCAKVYVLSLGAGTPVELSKSEISEIEKKIKNYIKN